MLEGNNKLCNVSYLYIYLAPRLLSSDQVFGRWYIVEFQSEKRMDLSSYHQLSLVSLIRLC